MPQRRAGYRRGDTGVGSGCGFEHQKTTQGLSPQRPVRASHECRQACIGQEAERGAGSRQPERSKSSKATRSKASESESASRVFSSSYPAEPDRDNVRRLFTLYNAWHQFPGPLALLRRIGTAGVERAPRMRGGYVVSEKKEERPSSGDWCCTHSGCSGLGDSSVSSCLC